jgi:hypothetical protein
VILLFLSLPFPSFIPLLVVEGPPLTSPCHRLVRFSNNFILFYFFSSEIKSQFPLLLLVSQSMESSFFPFFYFFIYFHFICFIFICFIFICCFSVICLILVSIQLVSHLLISSLTVITVTVSTLSLSSSLLSSNAVSS